MRKQFEKKQKNVTVKCYFDFVYNEYIVNLYISNKKDKEATYYTDNYHDAKETARDMLKRATA